MTWKVWAGEDELCFEFMAEGTHVIVSLDKTKNDNVMGYAIRRGNNFEAGAHGLDDPQGIANEINAALNQQSENR